MERRMNFIFIAAIVILALAFITFIWWYYPFVRNPWKPSSRIRERLIKSCRNAGVEFPPVSPRVAIRKKQRELSVYDGEKLIKTYRMALGTNPVDDKRKEGDACTPEGDFYVCTKNDQSRYHLFLGLSYPNIEDAERGRNSGIINESEYKCITEAIANIKQPPWNTRLGGEIGVHGGGAESDWTRGCIALSNEDIEDVFMLVNLGTPVIITQE